MSTAFRFWFFTFMFLLPNVVKTSEENVIYQYKQHEVVDLGELQIKGEVLAPSDVSIEERGRKIFSRPLLLTKNYIHIGIYT